MINYIVIYNLHIVVRIISISRYVLVIARCRVQYGKYFSSVSYFAIQEPLGK